MQGVWKLHSSMACIFSVLFDLVERVSSLNFSNLRGEFSCQAVFGCYSQTFPVMYQPCEHAIFAEFVVITFAKCYVHSIC
jgi:hypothetical protein